MFKFYIGKGIVKSVGDHAIKRIYSSQTVFNYPIGYIDKIKLVSETRNPFVIEYENTFKKIEANNANLIGLINNQTYEHNSKSAIIEIKNNTPVKFVYFKLFKEFLIIKKIH